MPVENVSVASHYAIFYGRSFLQCKYNFQAFHNDHNEACNLTGEMGNFHYWTSFANQIFIKVYSSADGQSSI